MAEKLNRSGRGGYAEDAERFRISELGFGNSFKQASVSAARAKGRVEEEEENSVGASRLSDANPNSEFPNPKCSSSPVFLMGVIETLNFPSAEKGAIQYTLCSGVPGALRRTEAGP